MAFKLLSDSPKESSFNKESIHRLPSQAAAGALSALPGFAGNIGEFINETVARPVTGAITGKRTLPYEETYLGKILPTTATHKKRLEEAIPYLKPKNKIEKFVNDISTDTAELFLPGKVLKAGKYAMSPLRSLGVSVAANTLGELTHQYTGDEKKAALAKGGTMLMLSLFNKPKAESIASDLYKKAQSILPANAATNATRLETNLNNLKSNILKGRKPRDAAGSEKFVLDEADKVLRQIQNGQVNVNTLVAAKRSLNENLQKFVFESSDKSARAGARKLAKRINGEISGAMEQYGQTNPEWWSQQKSADQAFGAINQSNYISRLLERFTKGRPEGLAHLFGATGQLATSLVSGPAAIGGFSIYQGYKLMHRIIKSPELRKHYAKVLFSSLTENPKIINKEVEDLQNSLEKDRGKKGHKYKILD